MFYLVNVFWVLPMLLGNAVFLVGLYLCFSKYARFEDAKRIYATSCLLFVGAHVGRTLYYFAVGGIGGWGEMLMWPPGDVLISLLTTSLAFLLFKKKLA